MYQSVVCLMNVDIILVIMSTACVSLSKDYNFFDVHIMR